MFEVLGKWSLCWPAFPMHRLFWGLEQSRVWIVRLCKIVLSSVSLPDLPQALAAPWPWQAWDLFMYSNSALLCSRVESVSIWGDIFGQPCLHRTCWVRTVFPCKWLVVRALLLAKQKVRWWGTKDGGLAFPCSVCQGTGHSGSSNGPRIRGQ